MLVKPVFKTYAKMQFRQVSNFKKRGLEIFRAFDFLLPNARRHRAACRLPLLVDAIKMSPPNPRFVYICWLFPLSDKKKNEKERRVETVLK